ncbi:Regulator of G-protein signaling egl-10 [Geodia barretti]|uniref:Regulator of G-protein signaling egl-10 n=1 Tax=Geodia barretti TaxID=519541 RepID=A0AA35XEQ5_GEOBA|nr:Regulator of G-protein signaling egl-10 [Geodia barretti]
MSSRQQQKMTPEHGLSMLPLLSPLLLSTAAPSAAAMSRHAPSERAAHSPAPPGGTPMLYSKMQAIAQRMLHSEQGVPIKSYKRRLISAIPSAFTGSDLVVWLMSNLNLDSKGKVASQFWTKDLSLGQSNTLLTTKYNPKCLATHYSPSFDQLNDPLTSFIS